MFKTLFGGGVGEMRLTDESNLNDSGIEIVASPPGKRLQNVLLLSGGEKSLTAMALLMTIFRYQPSPFCILRSESGEGTWTHLAHGRRSR